MSPVHPGFDAEKILKQMEERAAPDGLHERIAHVVKFSQTMMSAMSVGMNCVTLCLTTDPTNPLMWGHYSGLNGIVLGYDVDHMDVNTEPEYHEIKTSNDLKRDYYKVEDETAEVDANR